MKHSGGLPSDLPDKIAHPDHARLNDPGIDAAQVKRLSHGGIDEFPRISPETRLKLLAAGVGLIGDFDHGRARRQSRPRRQVGVAQIQVDEELIPGERQRSFLCATRAITREFMRLSCISGCGDPSFVRMLARTFQVSPTRPWARSSTPSSRTSRASVSGRRTISSSTPSSLGDRRISSNRLERISRQVFQIAHDPCSLWEA